MTLSVDLFWSFRSPYSYLALDRACALADRYDLVLNARPVYPLAVRDPGFFARTDARFVRYVALDSRRVAEAEGIPLRFPRPDPIEQDLQTLRIAPEQPRIRRLMHLSAAAQRRGRALPFIREVGRLLWDGRVDGWDQGTHLDDATGRAGLDPHALAAEAERDADALEALIADNEQAHAGAGNCLQGYAWAPAEGTPVRAAVVVVHGLGDHARRYAALAQALNAQGVAVLAQDHRGHAGSGGARQRIDSVEQVAGDVELALQEAARRWPGVPLVLHGHSFGGLVATHVAATATQPLAGVIISSAALQRPAGVSDGQVTIVRTLSALAPGLGLEPLDATKVVREPAAQAALSADPLIAREKLPARTVAALLAGVDAIQPRLPQVRQPLLVLHGGADTVTPPAGSRALHERAASAEKKLRLYGAARHDLLHEPEAATVTQEIAAFVTHERR